MISNVFCSKRKSTKRSGELSRSLPTYVRAFDIYETNIAAVGHFLLSKALWLQRYKPGLPGGLVDNFD